MAHWSLHCLGWSKENKYLYIKELTDKLKYTIVVDRNMSEYRSKLKWYEF